MQSASSSSKMSFGKDPRDGQRRVITAVGEAKRGALNCQLPTGYGKTFTAAASFAELRQLNLVDRLLYIVPRKSQLTQLLQDAHDTCREAGLLDLKVIRDVGYGATAAIKAHKKNTCHIFACTIQALCTSGKTWEAVLEMLQTGRWMIVVDEYHHYGNEAAWGQRAASLPCVFRLSMSATPFRVTRDSAFGEPEIRVPYRQALKESAVKKLICHSYVYKLDVEMSDGTIRTFTTEDIAREAGSDEPNTIERMTVDKKMRWMPKYVSPLVEIPINRALDGRCKSGVPQQVLVTAMCCSHAKLVCEQVATMFPSLRVDWVGTGDYGRPDKENDDVLARFCPPKRDGRRDPDDIGLDVLVHVGMAGEGLDSVYVTEVIHLTPANINNANNQKNGRGARIIPGLDAGFQVAYINVDSSSQYARYQGEAVMDLMDDLEAPKPTERDDEPPEVEDPDCKEFPEDPFANDGPRIVDLACIRIDQGDLQRHKTAIAMVLVEERLAPSVSAVLDNPEHELHERAERLYRQMKAREAEQFNARAKSFQLRQYVTSARTNVASVCMKRLPRAADGRTDSSLMGPVMKALNTYAKRLHGPCDNDASDEALMAHYQFFRSLKPEIVTNGIPDWLFAEIGRWL
jgi:superfamily II DNA or RNA helicase